MSSGVGKVSAALELVVKAEPTRDSVFYFAIGHESDGDQIERLKTVLPGSSSRFIEKNSRKPNS
ncbi:MAG: hypothetical protein ACTHXT_14120 [Sphingobacterium sp.]